MSTTDQQQRDATTTLESRGRATAARIRDLEGDLDVERERRAGLVIEAMDDGWGYARAAEVFGISTTQVHRIIASI